MTENEVVLFVLGLSIGLLVGMMLRMTERHD
jgi:hypothetical protein